MFIKLRNRFLSLHMIITSAVMITAFSVVYLVTYNNIQTSNTQKLEAIAGPQSITYVGSENSSEQTRTIVGKIGSSEGTIIVAAGDSLSFQIQVDHNGQILNIQSFMDLTESTYTEAAKIAWANRDHPSIVSLEGKRWQYIVNPMSTPTVIRAENGNFVSESNQTMESSLYQIAFLDVTDSLHTLKNLLITFALVSLAMLAVIWFISRYFASRAILPIAAAWEQQKQFVTDASHELKTPLSIINANYDALLANKEQTIESQIKWMDYMKIGTDRMTKLINDLLNLAKTENTSAIIAKAPFCISNAIEAMMRSMETTARHRGLSVSSNIEPDLVMNSDPELFQQLFTILCDNAIKYANEDGKIEVTLHQHKHRIVCSIKNSGEGIPAEDLPRIFDRFYRADPSRASTISGYGLGLSIARNIVHRLGGDILVASVRNEWTTFTIILGK